MIEAFVDGIGWWSPGLPNWHAARSALAGGVVPIAAPGERPSPKRLGTNERRRASDSVLLALAAAEEAVAMSGVPAASLSSVFTSAHGDLGIVDALCRTLAADPKLLSPTRFHHSVHNAASGYWGIGSESRAPSTALSAFDASFAAGLLEALMQVHCDRRPVLLVGCDTEAGGALAAVNSSRGLLGFALLLAPVESPASRFMLRVGTASTSRNDRSPSPSSAVGASLAANAMADALPLADALARGSTTTLAMPLHDAAALQIDLAPAGPRRADA